MKRHLLALVIVVASAASANAAVPETCLPTLPTTVGSPVFGLDVARFGDMLHLDFWRQPCQDGSGQVALLMRATPTSPIAFICGDDFIVIQNEVQSDVSLRTSSAADAGALCDKLVVPITVLLKEAPSSPEFIEEQALTIFHDGFPDSMIDIPAAGPQPPSPPGVQVVITGCNPCKVGDFVELHLHVINPGPRRAVEVKVGTRFPDGATSFVFLGRYVEMEIPAGESDILIPGITLPHGLRLGTYVIEGALLEPDLGATLSRHSVSVQHVP